jgi:hypothetical protein
MNKNLCAVLVDIGVLLLIVALAFGLWYHPVITVLLVALIPVGGCLFGHHSG